MQNDSRNSFELNCQPQEQDDCVYHPSLEESLANEELVCPHCKKPQYCHEPDEISATMCLTECEHCGEQFWYSVTVTRTYSPYIEEAESPFPDGDKHILACPICKSGEYLHNEDGNKNAFCGQCGKAINWEPTCSENQK